MAIKTVEQSPGLEYKVTYTGTTLYETDISFPIIYSESVIKKNSPDLEYIRLNGSPALPSDSSVFPNSISINKSVYRDTFPVALSSIFGEFKSTNFQNIVGQNVRSYDPKMDISGHFIDDNTLVFDISGLKNQYNSDNKISTSLDLILDTNNVPDESYFVNSWLPFINMTFDAELDSSDFELWGLRIDGLQAAIQTGNYESSINFDRTELTVNLLFDAKSTFTELFLVLWKQTDNDLVTMIVSEYVQC